MFVFSSGVSVTSSNTGVPDISGSVYTKTQVRALLLKALVGSEFPRFIPSLYCSVLFVCSPLRSRVTTRRRHQAPPSACRRRWAAAAPSTPRLRPLMPPHPSCTSSLLISSPTHRCCTTTYSKTPRSAPTSCPITTHPHHRTGYININTNSCGTRHSNGLH